MSLSSQLAAITHQPVGTTSTSSHKAKPEITHGGRICVCCGERERITDYGQGARYSTISVRLNICVECINQELSQLAPCPPI